MEMHGDIHMLTARDCCEECGRPYARENKGVKVDGNVLSFNGVAVKLTFREKQICDTLVRHLGETVHRDRIWNSVWGEEDVNERIIDVYICKLKKKLRPLGLDIVTTWGVGKALIFSDAYVVANVA